MKKSALLVSFLLICLFTSTTQRAAAATASTSLKIDTDSDGLVDWQEINFYKTDPKNPDTDGDSFMDGQEIRHGFSPHSKIWGIKFTKKIEVNTKNQTLSYYFDGRKINTFKVSTGKPSTPTPKGTFRIVNKSKRAWSKAYGLWMPNWLGLRDGKFGLHELPEWPNGYKEGAKHLGIPVSHGCIRLGVGPAKTLFDWSEIGTKVTIN